MGKGGGGGAGASAVPLLGSVAVSEGNQFALCVDSRVGGEWDASSPLLSGSEKQFDLAGDGRIVKKINHDEDNQHCVMTSQVMKNGLHRISFKFSAYYENDRGVFFGVVRDGVAWNERPPWDGCWFISTLGQYVGSKRWNVLACEGYSAGSIAEGAIVSLELDVDKGTLRFWLDGKPHGPEWFGGEKINGELRWAAIVENEGASVEIMPTPELEPWKEWDFDEWRPMGEELPPRSLRLGIAYGQPKIGWDRGIT